MAVFMSMSDATIATTIDAARNRVLLATPAFRIHTAEALVRAIERLGADRVEVVVDCDEEVFRLGFGDMDALTLVTDTGFAVRQSPGLRIGTLITDGHGWTFAPTALYVAEETHSNETPNAIALSGEIIERVVRAMVPPAVADAERPASTPPSARPLTERPDEDVAASPREESRALTPAVEIGVMKVTEKEVAGVRHSLAEAPPVAFDVARKVRVFESYIQYVEISLRGCAIQRHKLRIPRSVQGLDANADISGRLTTMFDLIASGSDVSSKELEKMVKSIRDDLTRPLGAKQGRVMLRSRRDLFDQRVAAVRIALERHRLDIASRIEAELRDSRRELVDYFLPLVKNRPPDALLGQIVGEPTEEQLRRWLDDALAPAFPASENLISEMTLDVQFRDVTIETLREVGFAERLKKLFPRIEWTKPFKEFDAAGEREAVRQAAG